MNWQPTKLSEFLTERDGRIKYESANQLGLQRIKKIDFSGNIHLDAETDTRTDMIRVKSGDLVISGINAAKGAIAVHAEDDDVLATIHYSAYEFNSDRISVDFLKWFFKSPEFSDLLREQIPGGIKTELKPKHILPLQVKLPRLSEQIAVAGRLNRFRFDQLRLEHETTHQQSLLAKLKQAILQEAIQGKLTADWRAAHPDVEPASQLLHRIRAEKARLIAAKKLRPEKPLPKITPAEIPCEIPKGWEWCWLGALIGLISGQHIEAADYNEQRRGVPYLTGPSDFGVKHPTFTRWTQKPKVNASKGDLLVTVKGSGVGKMNVLHEDDVAIGRQLMAVRPCIVNEEFIASYLHSQYDALQEAKEGQIPGIGRDDILEKLFPLPPLAEQAAIVERVEALMTTCRALEAEIEQSRTHAAHLLQAVLKEAFAPASAM